jgi:F-type H+-transporting ATPase subunit b
MSELFYKLGIDWKLILIQIVNFSLLLFVLTILLYKPLLNVIKERKKNVDDAIKFIKDAELKVVEIEKLNKEKIAQAENRAISIINNAQQEALKVKNDILEQAKLKSSEIIKETNDLVERIKIESLENLMKEAKLLVRDAILKTVSLDPDKIDEKLISKALEEIKKEKKYEVRS